MYAPVSVPMNRNSFGGSRKKSPAAGFTDDRYGYAVEADNAMTSVKVDARSRARPILRPKASSLSSLAREEWTVASTRRAMPPKAAV
jgi:hypothetical protein